MAAIKWLFLYICLTCFGVSIAYNLLLRWFASLVIWLSIILTGVLVVALAICLQAYHDQKYNTPSLKDSTTA